MYEIISLKSIVSERPTAKEKKFYAIVPGCMVKESRDISDLHEAFMDCGGPDFVDESNFSLKKWIKLIKKEHIENINESVENDWCNSKKSFQEKDYIFEVTVKRIAVVKTIPKMNYITEVEE